MASKLLGFANLGSDRSYDTGPEVFVISLPRAIVTRQLRAYGPHLAHCDNTPSLPAQHRARTSYGQGRQLRSVLQRAIRGALTRLHLYWCHYGFRVMACCEASLHCQVIT